MMSVDLPLSVCMIEATPDQPYLDLKLNLDPNLAISITIPSLPDNSHK